MKKIYEFKNGLKIEGTLEQILQVATTIGETVDASKLGVIPYGYYNSETKGLIKITDMNTIHIINALTKRTKNYFDSIKPSKEGDVNLKEYLKSFTELVDVQEIDELFNELVKRAK